MVIIQHRLIEGLLLQAMCQKLGVQRGVRLPQCPCVLTWLCIPGMVEGTLSVFMDGSCLVLQDLHGLLLAAQQSSLLSGSLSGSFFLINECLCP